MTSDHFIDASKLSERDWQEMRENPEDPRNFANIYNPGDYENLEERVEPTAEGGEYLTSLWGDFAPTFYQWEWYKFFNQRDADGYLEKYLEAVGIVHRRAGKSVGVISTVLLPRMLERRGLYLHVFPTLTQARAAIWNGMGCISNAADAEAIRYIDLFRPVATKYNNHAMSITLSNGSVYQLLGARGVDGTANHMRGLNTIGLVADEYPEWRGDVISQIFGPMFAQNGGFCFKIGTPKGENHAYKDYLFAKKRMNEGDKRMAAWLLTVDDTNYNDGSRVVSQSFIDRERERGVEEEIIQQEYYCSFKAAASGSWYKHQLTRAEDQGRVRHGIYDPNLARDCAWDLGGDDHHVAIVYQQLSETDFRILGMARARDVGIGQIMDEVNKDYPGLRMHYFPHDGNQRMDTVDAFQDRIEGLREKKGINNVTRIPRGSKLLGINTVKEFLEYCTFDVDGCKEMLYHLKNYRRRQQKTTGEFTESDVHDDSSHVADALRTLAVAWKLGMLGGAGYQSRQSFMSKYQRGKIAMRSKFNYNPLG